MSPTLVVKGERIADSFVTRTSVQPGVEQEYVSVTIDYDRSEPFERDGHQMWRSSAAVFDMTVEQATQLHDRLGRMLA